MNYIPEKLPKGTTREQWEQYAKDMEAHEKYYSDCEPDPTDYPSEKAYSSAMSEWHMNRSCFEPNKPGYYRANND